MACTNYVASEVCEDEFLYCRVPVVTGSPKQTGICRFQYHSMKSAYFCIAVLGLATDFGAVFSVWAQWTSTRETVNIFIVAFVQYVNPLTWPSDMIGSGHVAGVSIVAKSLRGKKLVLRSSNYILLFLQIATAPSSSFLAFPGESQSAFLEGQPLFLSVSL